MADNEKEVQAAFKSKVNELLKLRPNQWTGADSAETVLAMIAVMKDSKGKPVQLTPEDVDVITIASRPMHEVLMRVIHNVLAKHDTTPGPIATKRIGQVVAAPAFKMDLIKSGVIKETRANELSDLLS